MWSCLRLKKKKKKKKKKTSSANRRSRIKKMCSSANTSSQRSRPKTRSAKSCPPQDVCSLGSNTSTCLVRIGRPAGQSALTNPSPCVRSNSVLRMPLNLRGTLTHPDRETSHPGRPVTKQDSHACFCLRVCLADSRSAIVALLRRVLKKKTQRATADCASVNTSMASALRARSISRSSDCSATLKKRTPLSNTIRRPVTPVGHPHRLPINVESQLPGASRGAVFSDSAQARYASRAASYARPP